MKSLKVGNPMGKCQQKVKELRAKYKESVAENEALRKEITSLKSNNTKLSNELEKALASKSEPEKTTEDE